MHTKVVVAPMVPAMREPVRKHIVLPVNQVPHKFVMFRRRM